MSDRTLDTPAMSGFGTFGTSPDVRLASECAPTRTSDDQSEFMGSRPSHVESKFASL